MIGETFSVCSVGDCVCCDMGGMFSCIELECVCDSFTGMCRLVLLLVGVKGVAVEVRFILLVLCSFLFSYVVLFPFVVHFIFFSFFVVFFFFLISFLFFP